MTYKFVRSFSIVLLTGVLLITLIIPLHATAASSTVTTFYFYSGNKIYETPPSGSTEKDLGTFWYFDSDPLSYDLYFVAGKRITWMLYFYSEVNTDATIKLSIYEGKSESPWWWVEIIVHILAHGFTEWEIDLITPDKTMETDYRFAAGNPIRYSVEICSPAVYFYYGGSDYPSGSQVNVPPSVGGIWVPVDEFGLLAPYIGVASTIVATAAATAIYVKRRKKKQ